MSLGVAGAAFAGALAFTWVAFGFWAFVLVALAMLIGAGIGRVLDGRIDLKNLSDVLRGRRASS